MFVQHCTGTCVWEFGVICIYMYLLASFPPAYVLLVHVQYLQGSFFSAAGLWRNCPFLLKLKKHPRKKAEERGGEKLHEEGLPHPEREKEMGRRRERERKKKGAAGVEGRKDKPLSLSLSLGHRAMIEASALSLFLSTERAAASALVSRSSGFRAKGGLTNCPCTFLSWEEALVLSHRWSHTKVIEGGPLNHEK